jgi:hypothetical protein
MLLDPAHTRLEVSGQDRLPIEPRSASLRSIGIIS